MNRMIRVLLYFSAAAFMLAAGCEKIYEPPREVKLSEEGKSLAHQLVFMSASLRAVHDLEQIIVHFDFPQTFIDSPALALEFWDPQQSARSVGQGLAKGLTTVSSPLSQLRTGLARSRGTAARQEVFPHPEKHDAGHVNSLIAMNGAANPLRIGVGLPYEGEWDYIQDSIFGTYLEPGVSASLRLDTLLRYRTAEVGNDTSIYDREVWLFSAADRIELAHKHQVQVISSRDTVYRHSCGFNAATVFDTLAYPVTQEPWQGELLVYMRREDGSAGFFHSLDSAVLTAYRDTIALQGGNTRRSRQFLGQVLVRSSRHEIDTLQYEGALYYFSRPADTQYVAVSEQMYALGAREESRRHYTLCMVPDRNTPEICYYTQEDVYNTLSMVRYNLFDFHAPSADAAAGAFSDCSLFVSARLSELDSLTTQFGDYDSSHFLYDLQIAGDLTEVRYTDLFRRDFYQSGGDVETVEWHFVPASPASFSPLHSRPAGVLTTAARYRWTEPTVSRTWTRADTGDGTYYEYIWAGRKFDTLALRIDMRADNTAGYRVGGTGTHDRNGMFSLTAGDYTLQDTLFFGNSVVRVVTGSFDSLGHGEAVVSGRLPMQLFIGVDSVRVETSDPMVAPLSQTFTWQHSGSEYTTRAGPHDMQWIFTATQEDYLFGEMSSTTTLACRDIVVTPDYTGEAYLFGVFRDIPPDVFVQPEAMNAAISLSLWGENSIANGEYTFE